MATRKSRDGDDAAQLVRKALGKAGEGLSEREVSALAREFIRAGTEAVRLELARTPREAARLTAQARERLTRARMRVAEVSDGVTTPDIIVPPPWKQAERAMDAHEADLLRRKGVVGVGIAYRRRAGAPVPERVVVVLVEKKRSPDDLGGGEAIPAMLHVDGAMVPTDVVEAGTFQLKAGPGSGIAPDAGGLRGTLGCFATDREGDKGPVALTAMHLLKGSPGEFPGTPPSGKVIRFSSDSAPVGRLLRGTRTGVDAAKISVDSGLVTRMIPKIGLLRGARPIDAEEKGPVAMFGAKSGLLHGKITIPLAKVKELPNLGRCIITNIPARHGDSGALLVDDDRFALGLLVGGGDVLNAFTPMSAVLSALRARIETID